MDPGLARRRLHLLRPLQDSGASGRCFGLFHVPGALKRNRKSRVGERIVRVEGRQRQRRGDRLLQASGIAKRPHQSVMRLKVSLVGGDGGAEGLGGFDRFARFQQVESSLGKQFGGAEIGK